MQQGMLCRAHPCMVLRTLVNKSIQDSATRQRHPRMTLQMKGILWLQRVSAQPQALSYASLAAAMPHSSPVSALLGSCGADGSVGISWAG